MDIINGKYFIRGNDLREDYEFDGTFIESGRNLYEVMRVINGTVLFAEDHLERLFNSARISELRPFVEQAEIKKLLRRMIKANQMVNGNVKIIFHYGNAGEKTYMAYPLPFCYPSEEDYHNGVVTGVLKFTRTDPVVKRWMSDLKIKVKELKEKNSWYEVLLENAKKHITEGSQSNLFVVKGKTLYTAPHESVLPGITREKIIGLAHARKIKVSEELFNLKFVKEADAAFLSGTSPKILPVRKIGEISLPVGNKVMRQLMKDLDLLIEQYIDEHKETV